MKNHHIGPMIGQMKIFHVQDFKFDVGSAYFHRNRGQQSLAREWSDMWHGCATGQCDGNELDTLWCAWIIPNGRA